MAGPYFNGQTASQCGCFYPDVTRIRDDEGGVRILMCINHGEVKDTYRGQPSPPQPEPSEEWRQSERDRLSRKENY